MEKTKIYSRYAKRDMDAEKKKGLFVIKHADLEDIVATLPIEYKMSLVTAREGHYAYTCEMILDNKKIVTIGEASNDTLWTEIDRQYPVTMAWNRAFDRAMIKALDFESKNVFSNKEINKAMLSEQKAPEPIDTTTDKTEPNANKAAIPKKPGEIKKPPKDARMLFGRYKGTALSALTKEQVKELKQFIQKEELQFQDKEKMEQVAYIMNL